MIKKTLYFYISNSTKLLNSLNNTNLFFVDFFHVTFQSKKTSKIGCSKYNLPPEMLLNVKTQAFL